MEVVLDEFVESSPEDKKFFVKKIAILTTDLNIFNLLAQYNNIS